MNYDTFTTFAFSATAATERAFKKTFTLGNAIALAVFVFELACDAYESGQIVRRWYEVARRYSEAFYIVASRRLAPVVVPMVKEAIAYPFGVDRCWSAERLPVTLAANSAWWADVAEDYRSIGRTIHALVEIHLMGA
jgi:hypothetical protein